VAIELENYTFILALINIVVLYLLCKRFLFGPLTKLLEERDRKIKDSLEKAAYQEEHAKRLSVKHERELKEAKQMAQRIIDEARKQANKEYAAIIEEAKDKAHKIREKAKKDAEIDRREAAIKFKNEISSLALAAASKVLNENMDNERNKKLVEEFLDKEGVA